MKECLGCRTRFHEQQRNCPTCNRDDAVFLPLTLAEAGASGQGSSGTRTIAANRQSDTGVPPSAKSGGTTTRIATRPGTGRISQDPPPQPGTQRIPSGGPGTGAPLPPVGLPHGVEPRRTEELGWWPSGYRWGGIAMLVMFLPDIIAASTIDGAWLFLTRGIFAFILGILMLLEKDDWSHMARIALGIFIITDLRDFIQIAGGLAPWATYWYPLTHAILAVHAFKLISMGYSHPKARIWVKSFGIASLLFLAALVHTFSSSPRDRLLEPTDTERTRLEQRDRNLTAFIKDQEDEAKAWFNEDRSRMEGIAPDRAKEVVAMLYGKGAKRVLVGERRTNATNTWMAVSRLIIELPAVGTKSRKEMFEFLRALRTEALPPPGPITPPPPPCMYRVSDAGQRFESVSFGRLMPDDPQQR